MSIKEERLEIVEKMETLLAELREAIEKNKPIDESQLDSAYRELSMAVPWED